MANPSFPVLTLAEAQASAPAIRAKAMVFEDPASRELFARIRRLAPSDAPVLITGETGTGKELVARELHAQSSRAAQPFVAVNAGAFAESLIESELFGHERGAFTGAHVAKAGWFEAAHRGTLFLDEIGDLPLALQVKLLRVLQEGEIVRLGSRSALRVDVRLIAATNVDLFAAIREKRFREDLFYRLKVTSLALPPLRERPGDILSLARHFLGVYERRTGESGVELDASAEACLLGYSWPGNIRELENAIQHALLVRSGDKLCASDLQLGPMTQLPPALDGEGAAAGRARVELEELERVFLDLLAQKIPNLRDRVEAALLGAAYRYSGKNQLETARLLGMSRNVVRARLIDHGELNGPLRRAPRERKQITALESTPPSAFDSTPPPSFGAKTPAFDSTPASAPISATFPAPHGVVRRVRASIRVGFQKLGLLMLVRAHGAFDAALAARGMDIEWVEYDGGIQIVEALRSNALDVGVLGDCPAVFAQAEDVPIVYVAAEPPAPRGAALIVRERSPLRSVADLRGRRVAVNRAAQAHFLLIRALEEAAVDPSDVEVCFEPPERALRAFQAGAVDAWAIWDPWLSSARLDFGARVLRDATGLLANSVYYVARRDFAEHYPDLVEELLTQLQVAAHWAKRDPARTADLVAPGLGLSARALAASFDRELRTVPVTPDLIAAQQDLADTLLRLQLIPRAISVADAQWRLKLAG